MKRYYLFSVILALALQGCSGFMMQSKRDSVITESISPSNATVTFCGNAYMDKQEVDRLVMQRACELTLTKGFTHFVIGEKMDQSQICPFVDKPISASSGPLSGSNRSQAVFGPQDLVRPNVSLNISYYTAENAPPGAIDAQAWLDKNFPGLKFRR